MFRVLVKLEYFFGESTVGDIVCQTHSFIYFLPGFIHRPYDTGHNHFDYVIFVGWINTAQLLFAIPNNGCFPGGSEVKASACNAGDLGSIPGSGRFPGEEMVTHSSILAWRIPWTEEPDGLQSTGSQRVKTRLSDFTFTFKQ